MVRRIRLQRFAKIDTEGPELFNAIMVGKKGKVIKNKTNEHARKKKTIEHAWKKKTNEHAWKN